MTQSPDPRKSKQGRNIALALLLIAFVVIVYLVTLARLGGAQ